MDTVDIPPNQPAPGGHRPDGGAPDVVTVTARHQPFDLSLRGAAAHGRPVGGIGSPDRRARAATVERGLTGVVRQILLIAGAALAYFGVRALTKSDRTLAIEHAHTLVAFETRLHLHQEGLLQGLIIDHHALVTAANWYYIFGHWPVILASFIWLYACHRDTYTRLRNAMFVSGAIGLVIFWRYPVAPPRLADIGLVDTVTLYSHAYRVLQPPAVEDRFASLPSLHLGWNLLVGIALARTARHRATRTIAALSPLAMAAAVVLTANHYLVDVLAGAAVALVGLVVAVRLEPHGPNGDRRRAGRTPTPIDKEQ
ncbi:MAG: phosphatase PAP2 family protein [Acidimicrobiales bacterium]